MQKGIVFEINKGKATVMKNNGDFICVPAHSDWKKGDLVTVKTSAYPWKSFATIAACFLLFFTVSTLGMGVYFDEAALVSLDVNPSIELSLNRFDRVIDARSLNEEGGDILEQINVKNQKLGQAVSSLFDEGLGDFLDQNPLVTFTVFSEDAKKEQMLLDKLQNTADTCISSHHEEAQIEVLSVDEQVVNMAHKYQVTAGKYTALCELQKVLPEMEMERYSHHSISYIKEQTEIHCRNRDTWNPGPKENRYRGSHHN